MTGFTGEADVIIVGSGPAGVSAAWPLVEAGVRVLMLDASGPEMAAEPPHPMDLPKRGDPARWRTEIGASGPLADTDISPKFATPLARTVLAGFAGSAGVAVENYLALGSFAAGGLSRIWGALAARYGAGDLGQFPGHADEIEAAYARISRRIGVSGGQEVAHADPAMLTPAIARLAAHHQRAPHISGFSLITAPNAVRSAPDEYRLGCNRCGLCLYGCGRGSIYHSALELPALRRFGNFDYRAGVMAERLLADDGQIIEGRIGRDPVRFRARALILAAGTLSTTSLALRRIGHVGVPVRLENNPVGGIGFLVPQLIGRALPERAFGLGQMFYTVAAEANVEAAGVLYGADTLPLAPVADRLPFTRPFALRVARALAPALILATGYLPGRFSDNAITVEDDGRAGRIKISGRQSSEADRLLNNSFNKLAGFMRARGAWAVPGSRQLLIPGADAHPAATLPMGGAGPAATDDRGELRGAPGVYIADGASLPVLSARHPTLTIMANADWVGRSLARRLTSRAGIARAG